MARAPYLPDVTEFPCRDLYYRSGAKNSPLGISAAVGRYKWENPEELRKSG